MAMQINVCEQLLLCIFMENGGFSCVDCWMQHWVRIRVDSVQIETLSVVSPVSSCDSIWIQKWYEFEDEVL